MDPYDGGNATELRIAGAGLFAPGQMVRGVMLGWGLRPSTLRVELVVVEVTLAATLKASWGGVGQDELQDWAAESTEGLGGVAVRLSAHLRAKGVRDVRLADAVRALLNAMRESAGWRTG